MSSLKVWVTRKMAVKSETPPCKGAVLLLENLLFSRAKQTKKDLLLSSKMSFSVATGQTVGLPVVSHSGRVLGRLTVSRQLRPLQAQLVSTCTSSNLCHVGVSDTSYPHVGQPHCQWTQPVCTSAVLFLSRVHGTVGSVWRS